jgi:NADH:ubiquinone oxidoreductase subunit F (NADH-binding)
MNDIIEKIKESGLKGRGGAGFPTGIKWSAVAKALADKRILGEKNVQAYVVCNGSEGEPNVSKDDFILENHPQEVVDGIKIAMETIGAKEAYFVLRHDLFDKYKNKLKKIIGKSNIKLFKKTGGYLCGEESTMIEAIEGKERKEPRNKPPYPTEAGLWNCPTLVNNIETFYSVSLIAKDKYQHERFYTVSGDVKNPGVFYFPEYWPIEKVLHKTENFPEEDFFVQVGGGASGKIYAENELEQEVSGMGAIIVYLFSKTDIKQLMKKWIEFFYAENCGKCVPCREGVYRIREILEKEKINYEDMKEILFNLRESSFCPLGKTVAVPFESLIEKIIEKHERN